MILEKIKGFFKPTLIKIALTLLFLPILYLGMTAKSFGGGILTLAGVFFELLTKSLELIGPFAAIMISWVLSSYLLSCFAVFLYNFSKTSKHKNVFKILTILLVCFLIFFPIQVTSFTFSDERINATCNWFCNDYRDQPERFCGIPLPVKGYDKQELTCFELGFDCPHINCSEI